MIEWFKNLSNAEKIAVVAIVVPVCLAVIVGLFGLLEWPLGKEDGPESKGKIIHQEGSGHTAIVTEREGATVAGRDVNIGIKPDNFLDRYETTLKQLGQSEEKNINQQETIRQLEEQLSQPQIIADTSRQQVPQPTQEAKDLAVQIEDDAGPFVRALKAIAEGRDAQADELLDETQQFLDTVQEQKGRAQIKIYLARIQNATYAGRPMDALPYCDKLKPLAGDDSLILNGIATGYYENANYKEAEPLMRRALAIDKTSLRDDHPDVARDLNNLAQLLQDTNRIEEAKPLMQRVVTIFEKAYGEKHPNVAAALNNLSLLLKATNRLEEAEPLMRRALAIGEASFGDDNPDVAIYINNLAQLLMATNRLEEAEPLMRRALAIDEASFGDDHPYIAISLNNLAQLLQGANRREEAEPLMRRAITIFEKAYGEKHPNIAAALNNLAQLLKDTNRIEEAEPLMRRALTIDEASYSTDHPNVAIRLNNLARLLQDTNRLEEAEPLMERQLVIFLQFTRRTGHPHPHLKTAVNSYKSLLAQMGYSKEQITARLKGLDPEMFEL